MFEKKHSTALTDRQQRIHDFLKSNTTGVLATVDPNSEPHAVVIYHVLGLDFRILFLTRTGTKKYDNIIRNDHVMYVVFEEKSQTIVQVIGRAVEITQVDDINKIAAAVFMNSMMNSDGGVPPVAKLEAGDYTAFRIDPVQIRMASYIRPDSGDYDKLFESIESFELKDR